MNWKNLATFSCPYCGGQLFSGEQEVICTSCSFHISNERYRVIYSHRAIAPESIPRMHWQNLHNRQCPICSAYLIEESQTFANFYCGNQRCNFRIKKDSFDKILKDPQHPANLFLRPVEYVPVQNQQ